MQFFIYVNKISNEYFQHGNLNKLFSMVKIGQ